MVLSSVQAIAIKMEGLGLRMRNTKCRVFFVVVCFADKELSLCLRISFIIINLS